MKIQVRRQSELWIDTGCLQLLQCVSFPHRVHYFKNCSKVEPFHGSGPEVMPEGACSRAEFWWGYMCLWTSTCAGMGSSIGCQWFCAPQSLRLTFTLEFQPVQYGSTGAQIALGTLQPRHFAMAVTKVFPGTTCWGDQQCSQQENQSSH